MSRIGLILFTICALFPAAARAACSNPTGIKGEIIYNEDYGVIQFCNNTDWIKMGGSILDSRIGALTNTKWCNTDGTQINCTQDAPLAEEVDPKIGTLTAGKWCTTNGSVVSCAQDAPAAGVAGSDKQIQFNDGGSTLAGAANLYWDKANGRLGIGTATPAALLHLQSSTSASMFLQTTGASNNAHIIWQTDTANASLFGIMNSSATANNNFNNIPLGARIGTGGAATGGLVLYTQSTTAPLIFVTGGVAFANERMRIDSEGKIGIGTATPAATALLDLTSTAKGFLPPRMTEAQRDAIATPATGLVVYNSDTDALNYYDGSDWAAVGASLPTCPAGDIQVSDGDGWICSSADAPDAFSFSDQTDVEISTLVTSDIVKITGTSGTQTTSVSGDGSPQYRACLNSSCATVLTDWTSGASGIGNNQFVQLRLTSSASLSTLLTAMMTIGGANANWNVTTSSPPPVTPGSQNFTAGTTNFVVPQYNTLTIWLKAAGGGGGGGGRYATGSSGATGGASSCAVLGLTANGGGGGAGGASPPGSTGANGASGNASGGDINTTGGGAAGGVGGINYSIPSTGRGGTGGYGGYVSKTFTYGAPGAPVPGDTISVTISGSAAGGSAQDPTDTGLVYSGSPSTAGSGNATWN
jgi:hypothetical protein